jgi:hypothetical protein
MFFLLLEIYTNELGKFLETTMFADGRAWILKTDGPSLADIEGNVMSYCTHSDPFTN